MDVLISEGVRIGWSMEGIVTHAEGACMAVLGQADAALLGEPLHRALSISPERARALLARAQEGGGVEFVRAETAEGPSPGHEPSRTYLRVELSGASAHVHNLTELLRGAPPIQISRLSSSLSHEIRNPLSSVKMAVQTLSRNPGLSERDQRRLTIAEREIRTIERMLWMLAEYGRDTEAHLEPVSLQALVSQAAEMIDRELSERQTRVEVEGPAEAPRVRADTGRTRPVLAQLLLNVALASESGAAVHVEVHPEEAGGTLRIRDPASSLLQEEQETLFEPFGSKLARGAGLSLAALKQVMVRQGGQASAEAGQDAGTVFILTFAPA